MDSDSWVIDSLAFARKGGRCVGEVDLSALPRVVDVLLESADFGPLRGQLRFVLQGVVEEADKPYLLLQLDAVLPLRCQRCLGVLEFVLHSASRLQLVAPGAPWPDEALADDAADAIAALREQPVLELIEDEVLLALPIAPRHEEGQCPAAGLAEKTGSARSPFAALAGFKAANSI